MQAAVPFCATLMVATVSRTDAALLGLGCDLADRAIRGFKTMSDLLKRLSAGELWVSRAVVMA